MLAVLVTAAHVMLLHRQTPDIVQPGIDASRSFVTRTIPPAAVAALKPLPEPPTTVVAAALAPAAPRQPSPRPVPVAAAEPAPSEPAPTAAPPDNTAGFGMRGRSAAPEPGQTFPIPFPASGATGTRARVLAIPDPVRLRYQVTAEFKGISLEGEARLHWRHDGEQYEVDLEIGGPLVPTRTQRSTGRITSEGLSPRYFVDKARSAPQAVHFDPDANRVIFSNNKPEAAFTPGMQDRLSIIVQLSVLIAGEPARYPTGTQIVIPTASTREAENWIFDVEAEEDLTLPGGNLRAIKLQRRARKEYDQKVELWLAPRMDYAPVRVRLTNPNGDTVDQRWTSTDRG